tara:strand:- start:1381 stop:1590 length:210 start_codon:yes stop_codon:yes gene_type:complete
MKLVVVMYFLFSGQLFSQKYIFFNEMDCVEAGEKIIQDISVYKQQVNNNFSLQGWYTENDYLIIGYSCE